MRYAATALLVVGLALPGLAAEKDTRLFELRVYYAAPGKLDDLHARFRDHTMKLFTKHGMTNLGYWVPVGENPDRKLVYLLAYEGQEARKKAWGGFLADPDWKAAAAASEKNGRLVAKVESSLLTATDYSPTVTLSKADPARLFELRTYTATPGNLGRLNARFREHTLKLFEQHGMTNLWYLSPTAEQKDADVKLVYFLAHKSEDARAKSFDGFRKDPAWVAAREASERAGGGSLTAKDGVKSELLRATDYSPIR